MTSRHTQTLVYYEPFHSLKGTSLLMHIDLSALSVLFPGLTLDRVRLVHGSLLLEAHSASLHAWCPSCQQPSLRLHSRYLRTPRDLPISDHTVRLLLSVRRFFCDSAACHQRTFAEQF